MEKTRTDSSEDQRVEDDRLLVRGALLLGQLCVTGLKVVCQLTIYL